MDTFEAELLAAVRERPEGESPLRAFARFILDRSDRAMTGDGRRRIAELTGLVSASPSLMAREREVVARYTDTLAALLAEEAGASADDIEPRLTAEVMMAFHRSSPLRAPTGALTKERRQPRRRDPRCGRTRALRSQSRPRRVRRKIRLGQEVGPQPTV